MEVDAVAVEEWLGIRNLQRGAGALSSLGEANLYIPNNTRILLNVCGSACTLPKDAPPPPALPHTPTHAEAIEPFPALPREHLRWEGALRQPAAGLERGCDPRWGEEPCTVGDRQHELQRAPILADDEVGDSPRLMALLPPNACTAQSGYVSRRGCAESGMDPSRRTPAGTSSKAQVHEVKLLQR
jgi:hypothetical protein